MSMFYFLQRQSQTVSETQLCCGPTNTNTPEMSENEWCRVQNKWLGANALLNGLCQQVNCNLELYVNLMLSVLCFELSRLTSPKHNRHKLMIPGRQAHAPFSLISAGLYRKVSPEMIRCL